MAELAIHAFVMLFVTIGPVDVAAMFMALCADDPPATRRRMAVRGTLVAGAVLLVFSFGGELLLDALGVGLPAFRIGGGILLLLLAIDMVFARHSGISGLTAPEDREAEGREDISVFPLGIPLLAGPGAIASVVLLMGRAGGDLGAQAVVLAMLAAVLAIALVLLLAASHVVRLLGVTGVNVITRVLGIVLAALAVQFMLDGLGNSALFAAFSAR